jgi:hypothetical protein
MACHTSVGHRCGYPVCPFLRERDLELLMQCIHT